MLLAQTRRDRKETRAPFCTRVGYETRVGVCVCVCDAVFSTYKMAAQTPAMLKQCLFYQLTKWPPARMPGRVYRPPVRPLVLIYNSMRPSDFCWVVF